MVTVVVYPSPTRHLPSSLFRVGFSIPLLYQLFMLVDFHRILLTHAIAHCTHHILRKNKSLRVLYDSVGIEPTK